MLILKFLEIKHINNLISLKTEIAFREKIVNTSIDCL